MMTLITGGSKCGKSHLAEKLLDKYTENKFYIASMQPFGEEAHAAVSRHRRLREGKHFITAEKYTDIHELDLPQGCAVLLECMANLCANEMFREECVTDPTRKILSGISHLNSLAFSLVIVTNNVGSDGLNYSPETNRYIQILGGINAQLAEMSDNVAECVYGIPVLLKGRLYDNI